MSEKLVLDTLVPVVKETNAAVQGVFESQVKEREKGRRKKEMLVCVCVCVFVMDF
jgi:hypothetical protein